MFCEPVPDVIEEDIDVGTLGEDIVNIIDEANNDFEIHPTPVYQQPIPSFDYLANLDSPETDDDTQNEITDGDNGDAMSGEADNPDVQQIDIVPETPDPNDEDDEDDISKTEAEDTEDADDTPNAASIWVQRYRDAVSHYGNLEKNSPYNRPNLFGN